MYNVKNGQTHFENLAMLHRKIFNYAWPFSTLWIGVLNLEEK